MGFILYSIIKILLELGFWFQKLYAFVIARMQNVRWKCMEDFPEGYEIQNLLQNNLATRILEPGLQYFFKEHHAHAN